MLPLVKISANNCHGALVFHQVLTCNKKGEEGEGVGPVEVKSCSSPSLSLAFCSLPCLHAAMIFFVLPSMKSRSNNTSLHHPLQPMAADVGLPVEEERVAKRPVVTLME